MTALDSHISFETWRLIIIRGDGAEILVSSAEAKYKLPEVEIPSQRRIAVNINGAIERDFGLHVISLYEVSPCNPAFAAEALYHAAVAIESAQVAPADTRWVYTRTLNAGSYLSPGEFAAVVALLTKLETARPRGAPEPFLEPGWFRKARNWIERSL